MRPDQEIQGTRDDYGYILYSMRGKGMVWLPVVDAESSLRSQFHWVI